MGDPVNRPCLDSVFKLREFNRWLEHQPQVQNYLSYTFATIELNIYRL